MFFLEMPCAVISDSTSCALTMVRRTLGTCQSSDSFWTKVAKC